MVTFLGWSAAILRTTLRVVESLAARALLTTLTHYFAVSWIFAPT